MDDNVNMSKDVAEKRKKNREAQTKYRHRKKVRELILTDKIERLPRHIKKLQQLLAEIKDHLRSKNQSGTLNIKQFKQLLADIKDTICEDWASLADTGAYKKKVSPCYVSHEPFGALCGDSGSIVKPKHPAALSHPDSTQSAGSQTETTRSMLDGTIQPLTTGVKIKSSAMLPRSSSEESFSRPDNESIPDHPCEPDTAKMSDLMMGLERDMIESTETTPEYEHTAIECDTHITSIASELCFVSELVDTNSKVELFTQELGYAHGGSLEPSPLVWPCEQPHESLDRWLATTCTENALSYTYDELGRTVPDHNCAWGYGTRW